METCAEVDWTLSTRYSPQQIMQTSVIFDVDFTSPYILHVEIRFVPHIISKSSIIGITVGLVAGAKMAFENDGSKFRLSL